jgi:hypothetical protein
LTSRNASEAIPLALELAERIASRRLRGFRLLRAGERGQSLLEGGSRRGGLGRMSSSDRWMMLASGSSVIEQRSGVAR